MFNSDFVIYNLLGLFQLSIALRFKGHILVVLNLALMFCLDNDWLNVLSTQPATITLSSSLWLFLNVLSFLSFLKTNLNGLKQLTSKGYRTWEVWDGGLNISSPASDACSITSKVTCHPCPCRIRRCLFC
jgi:hypothetical protein